jgi:hypothetical protein
MYKVSVGGVLDGAFTLIETWNVCADTVAICKMKKRRMVIEENRSE